MTKTQRIPPESRVVEIVAFSDVQVLDVTGPLQVFESANDWAQAAGRPVPYRTRIVARSTSVRCSAGLTFAAVPLPRPRDAVDTLVVPGGRGVAAARTEKALVRWLRARAARARRVVSVCSGALLLGECGLLDGRRAATHWMVCGELAARFPGISVDRNAIFVEDGKVWSSAGVTAGIDLCLALVERDLGHAAAIAVARDLVVFLKRPGGQAQFSAFLQMQTGDARFDRLHGWIAGHLESDLSVPALAARVGMSERSFVRHYGKLLGTTPARAVERLRVEAARALLSTTDLPIKRVAKRCGFGTEETMRRSFLRQIAVSPQGYRERFRQASSPRAA
jgi:transcriptional regulator GlxA family with amidase domain